MDWTNISKDTLVEPYINEDGWYAQCHRCWTELEPEEKVALNVDNTKIGLG